MESLYPDLRKLLHIHCTEDSFCTNSAFWPAGGSQKRSALLQSAGTCVSTSSAVALGVRSAAPRVPRSRPGSGTSWWWPAARTPAASPPRSPPESLQEHQQQLRPRCSARTACSTRLGLLRLSKHAQRRCPEPLQLRLTAQTCSPGVTRCSAPPRPSASSTSSTKHQTRLV